MVTLFLFWTLTNVGMIFDKTLLAWPSEFLRCGLFLVVYNNLATSSLTSHYTPVPMAVLNGTFIVSLLTAGAMSVLSVTEGGGSNPASSRKDKKKEKRRLKKAN